ncbi:hypothetical protein [Bacillus mesophilum]|uniref:Uncharacterized protein n=1 Tax=Bacillus mesophilum TaxID=1071718 RepID=A0A7V7RQ63_9BACI|nr:hypothetical protein [Bacillus mesophilum]KAB2335047.1 hypothetical protein F7732_00265 [Bacillus mesophilum]
MKILDKEKLTLKFKENKRLIIYSLIAGIVIFIAGFGFGENSASVKVNEQKLNYDELSDEITSGQITLKKTEDKIVELEKELIEVTGEVTKKETLIKEASDYESNRTVLQDEANKLGEDITSKKAEVKTLETQLASISGQIKEKEAAPIDLPAGTLIVGQDIPADRYKVTPIGRGSNFKVYDSAGNIVDNTIISSIEGHGVTEYLVYLIDGYILENSSPFKFTPIE